MAAAPRIRRSIGPIERAVRKDLRSFPPEVGKSAIAEGMIKLASEADIGGLAARDLSQLLRELRLAMAQLREMAPPGIGDDELDKQRKKREERQKREGRVAE
jgi:actin-like ATPase involved in cell morphogenesis